MYAGTAQQGQQLAACRLSLGLLHTFRDLEVLELHIPAVWYEHLQKALHLSDERPINRQPTHAGLSIPLAWPV
jgi:hypothetical protein